MADLSFDIDPGGTGDYLSLNAFEAAQQQDLTDGGGDTMTANCSSSDASDDTTSCRFDGWTTSAANNITVLGTDFPSDGIYDGTKYLLHNNDSVTQMINIREEYVRIEKIQVLVTSTAGNNRDGIVVNVAVDPSDIRIDSCIVKGAASGTGTSNGINVASAATVTIFNTIINGFFISADTGFRGIEVSAGTVNIYNDTIYNCTRGISRGGGTVTAINCAVFNNDDDYAGTMTVTYSASDDAQAGTGNIQISQSADDWAALVVDAAGDDFHYTDESSELFENGNGATPKALFTDDIEDNTRPGVDLDWCIGAYDKVAAPAGAAGIMTTNTGYWGPTF